MTSLIRVLIKQGTKIYTFSIYRNKKKELFIKNLNALPDCVKEKALKILEEYKAKHT